MPLRVQRVPFVRGVRRILFALPMFLALGPCWAGAAAGRAETGKVAGAPGQPSIPEVAVDVGHTLADPGAVSARGRVEFEFNRDLAGLLVTALQARGVSVRPVNFDGRIASLYDRPMVAAGADFFISIHHDSVQPELLENWEWEGRIQTYSDRHRGFSLFISRDSPDLDTSLRCASAIGARLRHMGFSPATHHANSLPGRERPYADEQNAVHFYDNLVVLYRTSLPAVLFEAGVLKHRDEELALRDPQRQASMADAVASGIAACLYVRKAAAAE